MSPVSLALASILPADGPATSGSWFGSWSRAGQRDSGAFLRDGILTLPMTPPAKMRLTITEEGHGCFRAKIGDVPTVRICGIDEGC
jgi:hypothetical protein